MKEKIIENKIKILILLSVCVIPLPIMRMTLPGNASSPSVTVTAPSNNAVITSEYFTITVTASGISGGICDFWVYVDGNHVQTINVDENDCMPSSATKSFTWSVDGWSVGSSHSIYAAAWDWYADWYRSPTVQVTDGYGPQVSITAPTNNVDITSGSFPITVTASGIIGGICDFWVYVDGVHVQTLDVDPGNCMPSSATKSFTYIVSGWSFGSSHSIYAAAWDWYADWYQSPTISVTYNGPSVSVTAPSNNAVISDNPFTITATASGITGGICYFWVYVDGSMVKTLNVDPGNCMPSSATESFSFFPTGWAPGSIHSIYTIAVDWYADQYRSSTISATYDGTPVSIEAPTNNAGIASGSFPITVTAAGITNGICYFWVYIDGSMVKTLNVDPGNCMPSSATETFTYTPTNWAPSSTHSIYAIAVDWYADQYQSPTINVVNNYIFSISGTVFDDMNGLTISQCYVEIYAASESIFNSNNPWMIGYTTCGSNGYYSIVVDANLDSEYTIVVQPTLEYIFSQQFNSITLSSNPTTLSSQDFHLHPYLTLRDYASSIPYDKLDTYTTQPFGSFTTLNALDGQLQNSDNYDYLTSTTGTSLYGFAVDSNLESGNYYSGALSNAAFQTRFYTALKGNLFSGNSYCPPAVDGSYVTPCYTKFYIQSVSIFTQVSTTAISKINGDCFELTGYNDCSPGSIQTDSPLFNIVTASTNDCTSCTTNQDSNPELVKDIVKGGVDVIGVATDTELPAIFINTGIDALFDLYSNHQTGSSLGVQNINTLYYDNMQLNGYGLTFSGLGLNTNTFGVSFSLSPEYLSTPGQYTITYYFQIYYGQWGWDSSTNPNGPNTFIWADFPPIQYSISFTITDLGIAP